MKFFAANSGLRETSCKKIKNLILERWTLTELYKKSEKYDSYFFM